tara:strand:- start:8818 stop:9033 length:216 start_codon:yes stop_codon:yes gene_type:complete
MTIKSLKKSFDEKIQNLYDALYDVKETLDNAEDGELEVMADTLVENVESCLTEEEVNIEVIKDHISGLDVL